MKLSRVKIALLLSVRIVLMVVLQGLTTLYFLSHADAFTKAGWYWAIQLTIINICYLVWMALSLKKTGRSYGQLFHPFNRHNTVLFSKLLIPLLLLAVLPNLWLSWWFYQDLQVGATFLLGDVPWFFIIPHLAVFPVLQGVVELPFYFAFIMPHLQKHTKKRWIYLGIPVVMLSLQHAFMPLRFDALYLLYRSLMFAPFALLVGWVLYKKPSLLIYLVILHSLMNASLFMMIFLP